MIIPISGEPETWRSALHNAIRSNRELLDFVGLKQSTDLPVPNFPVLVPRGFASRIQRGNINDPLLQQVLAVPAEFDEVAGFAKDPLAETNTISGVSPAPGIIHKYHGRALLITTGACAVNCRYCFRRHFPYQEHRGHKHQQALAIVRADPTITEIVLSGGDPLLLGDRALTSLINELEAIPHLRRLRIHSRIPVVLPERITPDLIRLLTESRLKTVIVIHCNHANELDHSTASAFTLIKQTAIVLLNQSVLSHGVNDSVDVQVALAEKLFDQGVLPYYLHMPDRVAGTAHFFVKDDRAKLLYQGMQARLPGYLVPRLVREIPGESAKRNITI